MLRLLSNVNLKKNQINYTRNYFKNRIALENALSRVGVLLRELRPPKHINTHCNYSANVKRSRKQQQRKKNAHCFEVYADFSTAGWPSMSADRPRPLAYS